MIMIHKIFKWNYFLVSLGHHGPSYKKYQIDLIKEYNTMELGYIKTRDPRLHIHVNEFFLF